MVKIMNLESMPELVFFGELQVVKSGFSLWDKLDGYSCDGRKWWIVTGMPECHPDWNIQDMQIFEDRLMEFLGGHIDLQAFHGDYFGIPDIRRHGKKTLILQSCGRG